MLKTAAAKLPQSILIPHVSTATASTLTNASKGKHIGTKYAGKYTVTLIPGDGIGPELCESVKAVFSVAKVPLEWDEYHVSGYKSDKENTGQMTAAIDSLRRNKIGLKGIFYTPTEKYGARSLNVALRKDLDIYASVVSLQNIPGLQSRHSNVDFVIIRENTEGEYSGLEHESVPGVVESLKVITRANSERIARFAFDFALKNGRKKVTCVHKANIMKLGDGLFLNTCRDVAKLYASSGIKFEDMIVDNTAMQLVAKPQQFDVMVMPNLYGNIVSNIGAALVGGPGTVPGANIGRDYALFEPGCRHVAKDLEGKNVANPTSMLMSAVLMLRHLELTEKADRITTALLDVIAEGKFKTQDLGGKTSTSDFTKAIVNKLGN